MEEHGHAQRKRVDLTSRREPRRAVGLDGRTASAIVLRPIVSFAATRGVDRAAFLADLGVPESALDEPDHRIPDAVHDRAWREGAERACDPLFGLHVAQHLRVGAYDALDYALRFSATLHEAFDRMARFHRLLCDTLAVTVDVTRDVARVRRTLPPHGPHAADAFFGFLVRCARDLAGDDLRLRHVQFTYPPPPDTASHAAFFRCPVRFHCAVAELAFDARDFTRPVTVREPGLVTILERHMRELLARLPTSNAFIDRLQRSIGETLRDQGKPTLKTSARALHASTRTVQRRLEERGTTHRELVDDVRCQLATCLVETSSTSITEIAFLLGFADLGGFRRAYKRWTGKAPSSHRRRPD
jgi:AraC-like DNA-binding protein